MAELTPAPHQQDPQELLRVIEEANRALENIGPTPFSEKAFTRLKEKISEYTAQLITESVKLSKRRHEESISTYVVELASQYLVSSSSHKVYRHIGTFGGLLFGAGMSNFLAMVTTTQFNTTGIILSFILTAIGAFLVALHMARD